MAGNVPTGKEEAQTAKQKGNEAFAKKQWAEAVGLYTAAHYADPTEPTYPLNRAMAYIKLEKFVDAERDCTIALRLSPSNIKALYRRATAHIGAGNLDSAVKDYEAVLRLDPSNAEAEAGLTKAREALKRKEAPKKDPLDLRGSRAAHDNAVQQSSPAGKPSAAEGPTRFDSNTAPRESNSSVEAARRFLQQVGVSDSPVVAASAPTASKSALPSKFPGETGGFLREVTTRKTASKPSLQQGDQALVQSVVPRREEDSAETGSMTGSSVQKTVSALNFGGQPSRTTAARSSRPTRSSVKASPNTMSAIEFQRRWKSRNDRLDLLSTVDPESIPSMIDTMLEPELVADIAEALAEAHRSSPSDTSLLRLIAGVLQALPRCKRFGMTVSMLDNAEKAHIAYLIDALGRPDMNTIWELA